MMLSLSKPLYFFCKVVHINALNQIFTRVVIKSDQKFLLISIEFSATLKELANNVENKPKIVNNGVFLEDYYAH